MATSPVTEEEVYQALSLRMLLSYHSLVPIAPDRIRSFLSHLQREKGAQQFCGFPANLYLASEALTLGAASFSIAFEMSPGLNRDVTLRLIPVVDGHVFAIDFGSPVGLHESLATPQSIDRLSAGAHILGARRAMLSLEPEVNSVVRLEEKNGTVVCSVPPIVLWMSPALADTNASVGGMSLLIYEPDGSALFVATEPGSNASELAQDRKSNSDGRDRCALVAALERRMAASDWRGRFTAMLLAARAGVQELAWPIKQVEVPSASIPGVTNGLRHQLLAIQKAALLVLGNLPVPPPEAESSDSRAGMQAHLLRAVLGLPLRFEDDFSRLIDSLTPSATSEEADDDMS